MTVLFGISSKRVSVLATILTIGTLLSGCAATQAERKQDNEFFEPVVPETPADQIVPTGSLFRKMMSSSLYTDSKARRIGDIITIELEESTQASKKAKNEYDSATANTVNPITGLGGIPINYDKKAIQFGLSASNDFAGNAKADQSNSLSGSISVNVLRVYPNGNLMIRGEKWIELNTGREFIRLSGIIRQEDIGADNTITSTKVANARIEYSGTGDFHKGQQAGWLSQFFTSKWWPF